MPPVWGWPHVGQITHAWFQPALVRRGLGLAGAVRDPGVASAGAPALRGQRFVAASVHARVWQPFIQSLIWWLQC